MERNGGGGSPLRLQQCRTTELAIKIKDGQGNDYELKADEVLKFTVKAYLSDTEAVIEKTAKPSDRTEDGCYIIPLSADDTNVLAGAYYKYDIVLIGADSGVVRYESVVDASDCIIEPSVYRIRGTR